MIAIERRASHGVDATSWFGLGAAGEEDAEEGKGGRGGVKEKLERARYGISTASRGATGAPSIFCRRVLLEILFPKTAGKLPKN